MEIINAAPFIGKIFFQAKCILAATLQSPCQIQEMCCRLA
jgi:hypothetical protein